jgi:hypothetical protein
MTPTPEQLKQWCKDAESAYEDDDNINAFDERHEHYIRGYLRAKTEMLDEPEGEPVACPTCGEDAPFTGSCGTTKNDSRAYLTLEKL